MKTKIIAVLLFLLAPLLLAFAADNSSEPAFVEGTHYQRIEPPLPGGTGGRVEVTEVFWYGCPHCHAFEPSVESWLAKKPGNVDFVRVPVIFPNNPRTKLHARAFYAGEALGEFPKFHQALFKALNEENNPLKDEAGVMALFEQEGVSKAEFKKVFNSFGVETKLRRAEDLVRRYNVTSVPTVIVNGKYRIGGPGVTSYQDIIDIADFLAKRELAGR